jgi:serine/threonine-protein kinase
MNEPKGGRVIAGKFRLEWPIGRGGMGTVWAAMHLQLDMPVAVKFMDPSAADADGRLRFEREARAIAQLRSPHVVQVLDHGVDNGTPYIVMELLEGEDLEGRLRRTKKLTIPVATRIFSQSARALRRAHDAGIVHRDLKPNNVFLARVDDEEVVKLLDFGVAKLQWNGALDPHNESTQQGLLLGSPCYMSPEQARGHKNIDHRSDLWSLAVILFRSLTGVRPFDANTIADLIIKICAEQPPYASSFMPDAPPGLDDFFFRCFARDPDQRYQSALEMASDFEALVRGYHPSGDHNVTSGRSPMTRTASNPGMQAVGVPPRAKTNPAMPAVVITPQRALTNPQMQAVPAHIMPPGFERASQPGYDSAPTPSPASGSGGYPNIHTSPAAASYVPAQPRVSYPDGMLPSPQPPAFGSGTYPSAPAAMPAHPSAPAMPPSPEAYSSPGAHDPNAGAYGAYGSQQEGGYPDGSLDFNAEEAPDHGSGGAPPSPPASALPDPASQEGLGTTSQTVRERSPSNRQLVVWTSVAAAITAILVVLIVVVARARYGGGQAARPQGTGDIGVVAPTSAQPSQQPPQQPQQPSLSPSAPDTAAPVEPNPANPPSGAGIYQPGAPGASASASAAPAPDEVPFNVDGNDAGPSPPPTQGPPVHGPRPGGAPAATAKKKPNFGY